MAESVPKLVQRFVSGDSAAFAEIVARYRQKLYSVAYRVLGNHLDADEVVQETFVRIYHRRKELADVTNFTSFLIRIATNYAIDLLRKKRGHTQTSDEALLTGEVQLELARGVRTPTELFEDKEVMAEVLMALEQLPPRQKITAILHDIKGFTKREIAEALGCPEATVRSNLHIARAKLKKALKKRFGDKEQK
ncbi:MAG: RNA polymerase sigma factor [Candidatus Zixiibacteriota bacterium]|nr:MAG: RNA polymerase sigma factor [candidate division Zixibacteria bacterium]